MRQDYRLAIAVTTPDGQKHRFSPDEPDPERVPQGIEFSTATPGLFKDASFALPRDIDLPHPDEQNYSDVEVYTAGQRSVWEGRTAAFPGTHADSKSVTVQCIGHSAALRYRPDVNEVYVDRRPSEWAPASLGRRTAIAGGGFPQGKIPATSGEGGLVWDPPNEAIPNGEVTELWYRAVAGATIAKFEYRGKRTGTWTGFEAESLFVSPDDLLVGANTYALTLDDTVRLLSTITTARRYLALRAFVSGGPVTPPAGTQQSYSHLAAIGNHGLTLRALADGTSGVYFSDVLAHALPIWAPKLKFSTGPDGSIQPTTFAIPQLVADGWTLEQLILQGNAYHLWEWGVGEGREFFIRPPDPGRLTWQARVGEGAQRVLEGTQAEDIWNGVVVHFQHPDGRRLSVGPPGARADSTDTVLADSRATNPLNQIGERRWAKLEVSGFECTVESATLIGQVWLLEKGQLARRGELTITGRVEHPTEGLLPVMFVQAGDYIRLSDEPDSPVRRIIDTRYRHDQRVLTAALDNTVFRIEALFERIGINLVGRVI